MKLPPTSLLTICGLEELGHHSSRGVTHVLSILDPDWADPADFGTYDPHHRTTLRFHDVIEPGPGLIIPQTEHVEAILDFGRSLTTDSDGQGRAHLLVHCHMGISRSTAAMAILMAQSSPEESEERIFSQLVELRPQAWPNSLMVAFADDRLNRQGRLLNALGRTLRTTNGETARHGAVHADTWSPSRGRHGLAFITGGWQRTFRGGSAARRTSVMAERDVVFAGAMPEIYDTYLVPLIFESLCSGHCAARDHGRRGRRSRDGCRHRRRGPCSCTASWRKCPIRGHRPECANAGDSSRQSRLRTSGSPGNRPMLSTCHSKTAPSMSCVASSA